MTKNEKFIISLQQVQSKVKDIWSHRGGGGASGGLELKRRESVEVSNRENVNPASAVAITSNEKASSSSLIIRNIRTRGHTRSLVPTIPEEVKQESFDINQQSRP